MGQTVKLKDIPYVPIDAFRGDVQQKIFTGGRVVSFWGKPEDGRIRLFMVLARDENARLEIMSTIVHDTFPSLTPHLPQVHWFEREIAEQWGVYPEAHPWFKPIRFHAPYRSETAGACFPGAPSAAGFFKIHGEEIHEVAVGPVHAGIIEPGHFRFQCYGEHVFHLEISLGYQYRGIEKALMKGSNKRTIHYMETLAGDTTIGHTVAYAHTIETLSDCPVPARAAVLRGIMLELERLANHTGDLGALAQDIGYLPTASYCGRLRGDFLNITALLCGNRFGRSMVTPGGVCFNVDDAIVSECKKRIERTFDDVRSAVALLWNSSSVVERFEGTGILSKKTAVEIGLVGVAARACGVERDIRFDFPSGVYRFAHIPVSSCPSGDVFARAFVRWLEIQRSVDFIRYQLQNIPDGPIYVPCAPLQKQALAVSLVEGWRGEICHCAVTDETGDIVQYKIVDPSFHNWMGLALALRGEEISNFPLCNKSFNLSYCGHDL